MRPAPARPFPTPALPRSAPSKFPFSSPSPLLLPLRQRIHSASGCHSRRTTAHTRAHTHTHLYMLSLAAPYPPVPPTPSVATLRTTGPLLLSSLIPSPRTPSLAYAHLHLPQSHPPPAPLQAWLPSLLPSLLPPFPSGNPPYNPPNSPLLRRSRGQRGARHRRHATWQHKMQRKRRCDGARTGRTRTLSMVIINCCRHCDNCAAASGAHHAHTWWYRQ